MRYLLIDRVLELRSGESLLAIKNVTRESSYLEDHFPGQPVFPGALQIEAMAQAGGILVADLAERGGTRLVLPVLTSANARFLRMVAPGDQLRIAIDKPVVEGALARARAVATVDGEIAARAELGYALHAVEAGDEAAARVRHFRQRLGADPRPAGTP